MDETGQRLRNCAENCINAYDAWQGSRQNVAARESLQEAVHELRKVAAKLEIEVAISEREELTQRPIPIPPHRAARRRDQNGSELPDFLMDGPRAPRAPGSQGSQGNDFSSDDEGDMEAPQSSNFASPSEGRSGGRSGGQNRHMGQRRVGQNRRPPQSQNQSERSSNQQDRQQDRQNSASADSAPKEFNPQPPREREPRDTPPNREGTMSLGNMNTIASNNPAPATETSAPIQSSQTQTRDEQ